MSKRWIVVADSSRARIFTMEDADAPLHELKTLSHPESRLPARDLKTDGTAFRDHGQDYQPSVDPKQQEALYFAKQIIELLEDARAKGELDELVLIAAPAFLGILRDRLSDATLRLVTKTIDKDLVQLRAAEIREYL